MSWQVGGDQGARQPQRREEPSLMKRLNPDGIRIRHMWAVVLGTLIAIWQIMNYYGAYVDGAGMKGDYHSASLILALPGIMLVIYGLGMFGWQRRRDERRMYRERSSMFDRDSGRY